MSIRFGVLTNFLEADTLLLLSTAAGFQDLADRIAAADLSLPIDLREWGWVSPSSLTANLAGAPSGSRVEVFEDGRQVIWRLADSEKGAVVDQLRALGGDPRPGHQFLETQGDYQIIASQGEYPDAILD